MKNVITRSITGILYVAIVVGAILGGAWWFGALTTLFALLAVNEFNRITNKNFVSNTTSLFDIIGAVCANVAVVSFMNSNLWDDNGVAVVCALIYFLYMIARFIIQLYVQDGNPLSHLAHSILGQAYIVLPMVLLNIIYAIAGRYMVLSLFILIWLSDTGAFCVGSLLGKHKLFERISPHKSWEGFFGGFVFCLAAAAALFFIFGQPAVAGLTLSQMIGLGAVVCIFGTWGDLVESLMKRALQVKDSGNLLPGHGGILDRIDSLLIATPAMLLYLLLIKFL